MERAAERERQRVSALRDRVSKGMIVKAVVEEQLSVENTRVCDVRDPSGNG